MTAEEVVAATLELVEPVAAHVPVGAEVVVKLRMISPRQDALAGAAVTVVDGDRELATGAFAAGDDGVPTCEIRVLAPERLGTHTWSAVFPQQAVGGTVFAACAVPIGFEATRQPTSLAVWDLPAPAVVGERVRLKVGAKSGGGFPLKGASVEVVDEAGAAMGAGEIGDTPLSGSNALYWCELDLAGPSAEGVQRWSVRMADSEAGLPHRGSSLGFTFVAARPAEHRLVANVVNRESRAPIAGVVVRIGPHRATTDAAGVAVVTVPGGRHDLIAWHTRHQALSRTIEVGEDATLEVAMVALPPPREPDWM